MKRLPWIDIGLVLVVGAVAGLVACWITGARAQTLDARSVTATTAAVKPVAMSYWIAECSAWPLARADLADDGIRVDRVSSRQRRVTARLSRPVAWTCDSGGGGCVVTRRLRAHLVAHRLGSREPGWSVWSVRGPTAVAKLMRESDKCRVVATYAQARTWPTAARNWLMERSTCYGLATWRGRAFRAWPCIWSAERKGQGTITNLAAIGPGVVAGGSGAAAAGFEEKP